MTNTLMRLQAEQYVYKAPDGIEAIVVENDPTTVVFYVPAGEYQGYYHYDKRTGEKRIVQG